MLVSPVDVEFMLQALRLAAHGRYTSDPNPRVGAVFVKDNKIIAQGYHEYTGGDHAEIVALKNASQDVCGSTCYVTLEPCSHFGKTPPCCDALIAAGIKRLVVAMIDPNPQVAGQGIERCRAAGIEVVCNVLSGEAEKLNRGFIWRMTKNRPFVRSKIAMSLDGRTALPNGESKWITGTPARFDVQRYRAESSSILTTVNTVLADDPSMNARVGFPVLQPMRVILDSQLQTPSTAQIATLAGRTLILTCSEDQAKKTMLESAGFEVHHLSSNAHGRVDLHHALQFLAHEGVNNVWVEAGPTLNGALLCDNLVDEWVIYVASCVLGHHSRGIFNLPPLRSLAEKKELQWQDVRHVGDDLRLTLTVAS